MSNPPSDEHPVASSPAAPPVAPSTNALAIVSLVLSLVGFATFVTAIAGVIVGNVALDQISRTGEGGRSLARAGIVVGIVVIVLGLGILALGLFGWWVYYSLGQ